MKASIFLRSNILSLSIFSIS